MKHNNTIPNSHYHKDWKRHIRTWFDQPARKIKRRKARALKARLTAPRPLNALRPVVRCPTIRYNAKLRLGRGFTLDELKAASLPVAYARTVGISVDHRRRNGSEEAFARNVARLQQYKAQLIVVPRKKGPERVAALAEIKTLPRNTSRAVITFEKRPKKVFSPRKIEDGEKERSVYTDMRKALKSKKYKGRREKRAADEAAAAAAKKR